MKNIHITFVTELAWLGAYHRRLLHGMAAYARLQQWSFSVINPDTLPQLAALHRRASGLVLTSHPLLQLFKGRFKCPAVSFSAERKEWPWPCVNMDDVAAGRQAAQHLVERGFRRLAFVGDFTQQWWVLQRYHGFSDRAGELDAECVSVGIGKNAAERAPRPNAVSREAALARWIRTAARPVGIMAANDYWGARVLGACRSLGIKVPDDVAVVGVDDDDLHVEVCDPPLSSIPQQSDRMAHEAGELLKRMMAGERLPSGTRYVPPGELVVRQSSDTTASNDPLVRLTTQYIRRHLADGVSVKELLQEAEVSRTLLDERFRQALGRSAAEEIRRARIERARQLLSATDLPMPAVAKQAGFSTAAQFSKTFHRETNATPSEYRRRFRIRDGARP